MMWGSLILTVSGIALAAASPVHITPALPQLAHPTSPARWECDVQAWVRAPDLSPNALIAGDARLKANGTQCKDLVGWTLGLVLKERAIVRLPAKGVILPEKPQWNESLETGMDSWNDIYHVGWSRGLESPYERARQAYHTALSNVSLWEVHGAERSVFDLKLELASAEGETAVPPETVKSFGVAVPNVNLPPTAVDHFSAFDAEQLGFSSTETAFHYYFHMKLRNGSTLDVPAGSTAFSPSSAPLADAPKRRVVVEVGRPTSDRWSWRMDGIANCTADNTTRFEVEVEVPNDVVFQAGQELWLNTTVRRVSGSAQRPKSIVLRPETVERKTWCSKFAHSAEEEQDIALGRDNRDYFYRSRGFGHSKMNMRTTLPVKSSKEEQEDDEKMDLEEEDYVVETSARRIGPGGEVKGATKLDPNLDEQTVLVNFTIPRTIMPTFHATFSDYLSHIQISLQTSQQCGSESAKRSDDLNDDEYWLAYHEPHRSKRNTLRLDHFGNTTITIRTAFIASGIAPLHYTDPSALSPVLLPSFPTSAPETFPYLNQAIAAENGDQLKRHRYGFSSWRSYSRELVGGAWQHVGQVWARKEQREKERREAQRSAFVTQM